MTTDPMTHTYHPTPATWLWWRTVLAEIARAWIEPRAPSAAEVKAMVDDRDARLRAAMNGGGQ